jgi:hypothetical protein
MINVTALDLTPYEDNSSYRLHETYVFRVTLFTYQPFWAHSHICGATIKSLQPSVVCLYSRNNKNTTETFYCLET